MIPAAEQTARNAYVLDRGRIIEEGPYTELRERRNGRFKEMAEMQRL
jgi:ABC-type multidrug transport system fused ATPase/permease subunit